MRNPFKGINIPPQALPQNEFFSTNSWKGGLDVSDAPEDSLPGQSFEMQDMEVTEDDRLIRAPGVSLIETLTHEPTQVLLHAGFQYASAAVFLAAPFIGVRSTGATEWFDAGIGSFSPFGYTNFAGYLLLTNGSKGIYVRKPGKLAIELIPGAPAGFSLAVFAGRVVVGGAQIDGKLDFMGVQWSDSTSDYAGWDSALGSAGQSLIGSMLRADRIQGFASLGFETLVVVNRRSIWIGVETQDEFQPIRFSPRLEDTGCSHSQTITPTEFGVLFLSDDGVRLFTGSEAPVVSSAINRFLGPIHESDKWTATFDPFRKRYYLHGPTGTFVFDILRRRWFRWTGTFLGSVFFPSQGARLKWSDAVGTWGSQTLAWWQLLPQESGGAMYFVKNAQFGMEDPSTFNSLGGTTIDPRWFDRVQVGENQDQLMTGLGARFTYEASAVSQIELWLPDKPDGNYEPVRTASLPLGLGFTKRAWVPFIHTGRGIGLGLRITAGSPRIRRASVEYQRTGMLFEATSDVEVTPPPPVPVNSDAILKPKSLYYNSYEAGIMQSIKREIESTADATWALQTSGGRENGGYALSIKKAASTGGQYSLVNVFLSSPLGGVESLVYRAGKVVAFNLFGQALTVPMNCMAFMAASDGFSRDVQIVVSILPDLRIQVSRFVDGALVPIQISTQTVPPTGWFALEWQAAVSKLDNPLSGFVVLQLYTPDGPVVGFPAIRATEVNTLSSTTRDTFSGYAWGTEVIPSLGPGLDGIGVDDIHLYGHYGTVNRLMGNTFIGVGLPSADGDVIESVTSFDSSHVLSGKVVGGAVNFGETTRVNNLSGGPTRPNFDEHFGEVISESFDIGDVSSLTGDWLAGPFFYGADHIIRNAFTAANKDLYRLRLLRAGLVDIEGVAPFAVSGVRAVAAALIDGSDAFNWVGQASPGQTQNHTLRVGLVLGAVTELGRYDFAPVNAGTWKPLQQYTTNPWTVLDRDPAGNHWIEANLALVQGLIQGDFTLLDALIAASPPDTFVRSINFDICQFGIEFAYRKAVLDIIEHAPYVPLPKLVQYIGTNLPLRHLVVRDASTSWDSTIVSRVIDWGDGSPTEPIGETSRVDVVSGGSVVTLTHDYEFSGDYTVTLTVTDGNGLTAVDTMDISIANVAPTANFSFAANPSDMSGLTIDFTDLSTDPDGTIASWDWDFGDGSPHGTTQNPTHVYAGAGTPLVTLRVIDNNGALSSPATVEVDVPIVTGGGDCSLSTGALADTAGYQGDDFAGGNPPLPSYINTTAFDAWYEGSNFREAYDTAYASAGVDHAIDSSVQFNGHSTLRQDWGAGHTGAGWDTVLTDDGDPTETAITDNTGSGAAGPIAQWMRMIWKSDPGIVPGSVVASYEGLLIQQLKGRNVDMSVYMRQGRLKLDVQTRTSFAAGFTVVTFDLCDSALFERTDGLFGELITLAEVDEGANTMRVRAWAGNACSLGGVSPLVDQTITAFGNSGFAINGRLQFDFGESRFNWTFTPAGAIKSLWVALWETVPKSVAANPYGVALI